MSTKSPNPRQEHDNALARYFKEMSKGSLLTADEEVSLTQELRERERLLWAELLSYGPLVAHTTGVIDTSVEQVPVDFRSIKAAATKAMRSRTKRAQIILEGAALKLAPSLRDLDPDQELARQLVEQVKGIAKGSFVPIANEKPPAETGRSKAFQSHVSRLETRSLAVRETRNHFVTSNLGLVVSVARRYRHSGMSLADLIQEGNLGLLKAVERFDHERGFRFSTYATWWIRHSIGRGISDKSRTVRVPVHVMEAQQKITKLDQELNATLGRPPTRHELAEAVDMPIEKLEMTMQHAKGQSMSLDAPLGDDGDRERGEVFSVDDQPTAYDMLATQALIRRAESAMKGLQPLELDILYRRFGLDGRNATTLQEIADAIGKSRERIRQIQERALTKLRDSLIAESAI